MAIKPPNSPSFSVAGAGARLSAGIAGIYQKSACKPIAINTIASGGLLPTIPGTQLDNDGNSIRANLLTATGIGYQSGFFYGFNVRCPSARIRVAFGVTQPATQMNPTGRDESGGTNYLKFVNVFPGIEVDNIFLPGVSNGPDISNIANGPALYPYPQLSNRGRAVFHEGDLIYGGYDGTATNSGGTATPSGEGFPFAYEAISSTKIYRVRVGCFVDDVDQGIAPIFAWANWEIIDPRDGEDTTALLDECIMECPNPIALK